MHDVTGLQLRRLRKKKALSVAKSAALVHTAPRTWVRWESGETPVPEMAVHLFCLLVGESYRRPVTHARKPAS